MPQNTTLRLAITAASFQHKQLLWPLPASSGNYKTANATHLLDLVILSNQYVRHGQHNCEGDADAPAEAKHYVSGGEKEHYDRRADHDEEREGVQSANANPGQDAELLHGRCTNKTVC